MIEKLGLFPKEVEIFLFFPSFTLALLWCSNFYKGNQVSQPRAEVATVQSRPLCAELKNVCKVIFSLLHTSSWHGA